MKQASRWYERSQMPYHADREIVESYADWLRSVPWQVFCTFTFAWRVSDPQAIRTFAAFINKLERHYCADITYVRGDEKRFSGCGKPACARHFHTLLVCAHALDPHMVQALWTAMAGNRSEGSSALVVPFEPALDGVSYVLKRIYEPEGDWDFRKLELFHPNATEFRIATARSRRHFRRHLERQRRYASGNPAADLSFPRV